MKRALHTITAIAVLAVTAYSISGCNQATMLGQNLIPGVDSIHTFQTDTFTVTTQTVYRPDSLITSFNRELTAGVINENPAFGKTTAIAYAQLGLSAGQFFFEGENVGIDSVVLSFGYMSYYGDSLGRQDFSVYRITDPSFNDTTGYYAFQQFTLDQGNPLGSVSVTPKGLEDSVSVFGEKEAPQLRVRLSSAFAAELSQQKTNGAFYNDSAFHAYLRGFALVPDSVSGGRKSLVYLDLLSDVTGMTVFYHNSTEDSLTSFFPFTPSTCGSASYIHRDYNGSDAAGHFGTVPPAGDTLIYLQDRPGLYVDVQTPYLQNFPNAIINNAELIITQVRTPGDNPGLFTSPNELFLFQYLGADSLGYVFDAGAYYDPTTGQYQFSNLAGFGGIKTMVTNASGEEVAQYRFNISRYLQHLVTSRGGSTEVNKGFKLEVFNAAGLPYNHGQVVLGGGGHSGYAMKLRVIYTKIK